MSSASVAETKNSLIDTHFVFWYAKGNARLPEEVRNVIEDPDNSIFVSDVSLLEVAIKYAKNPEAMPYSESDFVSICSELGFTLQPLTREAILAYETLDLGKVGDLHKNPFDRLLVSHAKAEALTFVECDRLLAHYEGPFVRVYA